MTKYKTWSSKDLTSGADGVDSTDTTQTDSTGLDWTKIITGAEAAAATLLSKPSGSKPQAGSTVVVNTPAATKSSSGLSTGAIIGIVAGGALLLGTITYFAMKK